MENDVKKEKKNLKAIIGRIIFLIFFIPILIVLLIISIKSAIYPNKIPDVLGYKPFIVLVDTKTKIEKDDLILTKMVNTNQIQIGDIIAFKENNVVETHEVINIQEENNETYFIINVAKNNEEYIVKVDSRIVEGKYLFRIANLRWNAFKGSKLFYSNSNSVNNRIWDLYKLLQKKTKLDYLA